MMIALLIEDNFDEQEFIYPFYRVQEAGFKPLVVGPEAKTYKGKTGFGWQADVAPVDVDTEQLSGLIVPGGYAPDRVRRYPEMLELVSTINKAGKPLGSICHASWVIISAKVVAGRMLTGHPSTKDDLENAGAHYSTERVVVDGNLVTAQHYRDLPMFMKAFLERF
ncbi:MAG: type 1 glutamine amidotransferase domain-containing protein [Deinococcota bacterium]